MSFKPEKKSTLVRVKKNVTMTQDACDTLAKLATAYESTEGKTLEALLETYGPALLRAAQHKPGGSAAK